MIQLKSISVGNFRKFSQPVLVAPLQAGINIIAGDNEEGKSTIVAAVKAAFYKKYSSTTADELQPYNSSLLPTVCLEFDWAGGAYRLLKAFGKKGTAELRCPNNVVFSGSQAEEKLRELLRIGDEKRAQTSIWSVLLVEQGKALQAPALSELGKQTIESALQTEVGKMVAGESGDALMSRIQQLYANWYTDTGRHKLASEYKQSEKKLEELDAQFKQKTDEYEAYKQTLHELQEARALLKQHEDEATLEQARRQVEAAQMRAQTAGKRQSDLERLKAVADAEQAQHEVVAHQWQARRQVIEQLATAESSLSQMSAHCTALQQELDLAAQELHRCQQEEEEAERLWQQAERAHAEAERLTQAAHLLAVRRQLQERLAKAQAAQAAADQTKIAAAAIKVDRVSLQHLRSLESRLLQGHAQLQSVATRIEFMPQPGQSVSAAGEPIALTTPILLSAATTFELAGWGALHVVPGGKGIEQLRQAQAQNQLEFEAAATALQVENVSQAEEKERQKTALSRQFEEHLRDVGKYAGNGMAALQAEIAAVEGQLAQLGSTVATASRQDSVESAPSQAMDGQVAAAKQNADCRLSFQQARQASQNADRVFRVKADELKILVAEQVVCQKSAHDLSARLLSARQSELDDQLSQRLAQARAAMEKAAIEKQALACEIEVAGADVDAQKDIAAALARLQAVQKEVDRLRDARNLLAGSLKTFGKAGIAEEFHKLAAQREHLQMHVLRLQKRAAAVKLLYDTMTQAQQSAKSHLMRPLLQHLKPYVEQVFDGAALTLHGDSFGITQVARNDLCEDYGHLSIGTQEQLSVLARLSFAHVLAENNCPALLVLDDVLVYSDAGRLRKMQGALKLAAERFQIIVLTCRPADWQLLGVPVLQLRQVGGSQPAVILDAPLALDWHQTRC